MASRVIVIFDAGKTNKKVLLFDEQYKVVHEESVQLPETKDEDGFACEDIDALTKWIRQSFGKMVAERMFDIGGLNFSAYGASLVHLDSHDMPFLPLYNYLKPYPPLLQKKFYDAYGGEGLMARETASPVLGNLNSGMQLYWLKYERPELFDQVRHSLHLPQYLSFVLASKKGTDITSVGCHTHLWDFGKNDYHRWVYQEGLTTKFAPLYQGDQLITTLNNTGKIPVGIGLHDSSAALIPYLINFLEPFILLSTGTWCISLNPFNQSPLTDEELKQDCLCYLSYKGTPVKASRLFAGYEHEQQVKKLAEHFHTSIDYYTTVNYDHQLPGQLELFQQSKDARMAGPSIFENRDLNNFKSYEEAYHLLIADLVVRQKRSTELVLKKTGVKRIFVDGGFSKNPVYMHLLAAAFPQLEVFAASMAQATALGAALAIHSHWNKNPLPGNLMELKYYPSTQNVAV